MTEPRIPPRPRIRRLPALLAFGALGVALLPAGAAVAAPASVPEQSCWVDVDTGASGCFDAALDPHEQIELATGNPLVAVESGGAPARAATPGAAAAEYLLLTGWDDINQSGASKSFFTSKPPQCGLAVYGFQSLGTFNNTFESIQSYNGCLTTLYDGVDYLGEFTTPIAVSNDLGVFRNRAESFEAS